MAPECIDGHGADERSDVFSMGTVLYWITTGSLPFEALTPHALLKQIVDGRAPPAQQKSPRVSDDPFFSRPYEPPVEPQQPAAQGAGGTPPVEPQRPVPRRSARPVAALLGGVRKP